MPRNEDDNIFSQEFIGTLRRSNGNKRPKDRESKGLCKVRSIKRGL